MAVLRLFLTKSIVKTAETHLKMQMTMVKSAWKEILRLDLGNRFGFFV